MPPTSSHNDVGVAGSASPQPRDRGLAWLDGLLIRALGSVLRQTPAGRLQVTLPSGRSATLGPADSDIRADIALNSYRPLWPCVRRGQLGFADSYLAGDIDTSSLHSFFDFYIDAERAVTGSGRTLLRTSLRDRLFHLRRANTRTGSRRNIAAHYDLGNAFYSLWLDAGMTYSSGVYAHPGSTLEQAQQDKYDRILAALDLEPGQTLLEIGCGWGGLAEAAARRGASVTGITISAEQFDAARARLTQAGLGASTDIRFEDYRDTTGQFDRLASIEMIEAVGEDNWPIYFRTLAERLKPGGIGVLQAITIDPDYFEGYRRKPDFIQRYIFPGGMLPTVEHMRANAATAGLVFETIETFGASYALTLAEWRRRFDEAWPRIEALGFDQRFRRMWIYYLTYCEIGFQRGTIDVGHYRLRKPK